ncbi:amino acid adenylation domain-containing protein [Corynebacterium parakroppenstedtii]|uniref:amino acid adenylation domain-containing protein n=2 Tax=Corynebacterium parakroppenstedtii TaxID=2828363 RepID=UPI001C8F1752|nr:amino acid adenylation domain-containing protein [Corynebacterium parakroppenstedtii]MBY0788474.1 amino acid adenylation domain-containing protein [Corynebacterium parakroppenstedtii]
MSASSPWAFGPSVEIDPLTVDVMIDQAIRHHREQPAVHGFRDDGSELTLTYDDVDSHANAVAWELRHRGAGPGDRVVVLSGRSPWLPSVMVGVLRAGAAYVPVDASYPAERTSYIVNDCQPDVVIGFGDVSVPASNASTWELRHPDEYFPSDSASHGQEFRATDRTRELLPEDPCYVIYTSGTTGNPKGAVNPHRAVASHLQWVVRTLGNDAELGKDADSSAGAGELRMLHKAPIGFDVGVAELLCPLACAGRIVIPGPDWFPGDPFALGDMIETYSVTTLSMVPSMLRVMFDVLDDVGLGYDQFASVRHLLLGGEAVPNDLVERARAVLPSRLLGLYGPSETAMDVAWVDFSRPYSGAATDSAGTPNSEPTADSNHARVISATEAWADPSTHDDNSRAGMDQPAPDNPTNEEASSGGTLVGWPEDNVVFYVVDEKLNEVPDGQSGELCIAGAQVGAGYFNNPEVTAEAFVPSLHPDRDGGTMYRTGDVMSRDARGMLRFEGRIGDQVKIRGNRVELGDVETHLRRLDAVNDAAVAVDRAGGEATLVGGIVVSESATAGDGSDDAGHATIPQQVKVELGALVPEYMVPSVLVVMTELPHNDHGKIDRRALIAHVNSASSGGA